MDSTALGSGLYTTGITGIGAILTTPDGAGAWMWLVGLVITGLFGIASSVAVVIAKYFIDELRERKRLKSAERAELNKDRNT